jgi:predicted  nucleic acid-binding Zn-ribbon protein
VEDLLGKALPVVVLLVQGLFAWVLWSLRRNFMSCDACQTARAAYEKRQDEHDKQLASMAAEGKELRVSLDSLPTARDVHELGREVEAVRGGLEAMRESIKSLGISIDRLDKPIQLLLEHHINGGGK